MMELVTGGSGSGKSAYAEERICTLHRRLCEERNTEIPLYYIADMIPYGRETEQKIGKHRQQRAGKGFVTLEWYVDLPGKLSGAEKEGTVPAGSEDLSGACVLLECVSNLTANEMYEPGGAGVHTVERITEGVRMLRKRCAHLVVVTNDVFRESVPDSDEMARYKKNLGAVNRALAQMADRVTEVVFGRPVCVKGEEAGKTVRTTDEGADAGMVLITGGAYQGKLEYAKEKYKFTEWTDGAVCGMDEIRSCRVMDHFHLFIRRWLQAGKTQEELIRLLLEQDEDQRDGNRIIICDETGCGLVPVDAFEREYREAAGRICTALAEHADEVYRVVCGIGMRLK